MINYHKSLKHADSGVENRIECCVCGLGVSRPQLWDHLCTHGDDLEQRKCELCHRVFSSSARLAGHMKRAHADSKERLRCACCDFTTTSKAKLKRHEESVHGKENLVCSVCHVICVGVRCLNEHLKTSHGRPELYKCDQCSYFSYKRSNLTKHLKTHTASLSLSCQHCDFACKWSNWSLSIDHYFKGAIAQIFS